MFSKNTTHNVDVWKQGYSLDKNIVFQMAIKLTPSNTIFFVSMIKNFICRFSVQFIPSKRIIQKVYSPGIYTLLLNNLRNENGLSTEGMKKCYVYKCWLRFSGC